MELLEFLNFNMPPTRSPYDGPTRKLVLAFDIGTTYSGISYSILDPGQIPEIKGVTRFPAQENVGGDSKIPTIIYYDQNGTVRAVGAEAIQEHIKDTAEDENWIKAEWFKLHMRPRSGTNSLHVLPPLPARKSVTELFADFMEYLYKCAKTYIQETHVSGTYLWTTLEQNIEFVLTHPNGWEGAQQQQMRQAAILAGLVPDTAEGYMRIHFVTEGEASLHFCIQKGLMTEAMENGNGVLIVDAGGGTIDLSTYARMPNSNEGMFEEIAVPQCLFQGSVFVTNRAGEFFETYFRDSKFSGDVDAMTDYFDKKSKLTFANIANPLFIKFGGARDKDPRLNVRSGQFKLLGTDAAAFFDPSISSVVQAILELRGSARKPISSVFLVGGFSANEWLFSQLKDSLEPVGLNVCRPDRHLNKAVADGAISFYLDRFVAARMSRFTYGISCRIPYDMLDPEHGPRSYSIIDDLDGVKTLPNAFSIILSKNIQVTETQEFRKTYIRLAKTRSPLEKVTTPMLCYRGSSSQPKWIDVDPEMYSTLCYVEADTSQLCKSLPLLRSSRGPHYRLELNVILLFGLTELKAQISWMEDGEEKRSPAKIVYDPMD